MSVRAGARHARRLTLALAVVGVVLVVAQRGEITEMLFAARRAGLDLAPAGVDFDTYQPETTADASSAPAHG